MKQGIRQVLADQRWEIGAGLLLVAATWAVFGQTLTFDFVNYDDPCYVTANMLIQTPLDIFSAWDTFLEVGRCGNWHPLTWISLMLDYQLHGLEPWGYHLTNLLLHSANTVLLFVLFRWATGRIVPSALVAGFFAVHPSHVESVAWIAERKDMLSTFFWMLTTLAYLHYVLQPGWRRYQLVLLSLTLGLLAKPMLVTLPATLLLLDYWPLNRLRIADCRTDWQSVEGRTDWQSVEGRTDWQSVEGRTDWQSVEGRTDWQSVEGRTDWQSVEGRTDWQSVEGRTDWQSVLQSAIRNPQSVGWLVVEKIPLFVLSASSAFMTIWAQQRGDALRSLAQLSIPTRLGNALLGYGDYLRQLFWPLDLWPIYPLYPWHLSDLAAPVMALALVSLLVALLARRCPALVFGWLWFLGTLIPVIGLVQVGVQAYADRYTYIPFIGLFVGLVWLATTLANSLARRTTVWVVLACLVAVSGTAAYWQTRIWRNSVTLWEHTLTVTRDNFVAQSDLALAYWELGKDEEAMSHQREADAVCPDNVKTYVYLARVWLQHKRPQEAIACLEKAMRKDPGDANLCFFLSQILRQVGREDEAKKWEATGERLESARGSKSR